LEKVTRRETKFRTVEKPVNLPTFEEVTFRTEAMKLLQHERGDNADELDLMITEKIT
jgi:hypothetical protein